MEKSLGLGDSKRQHRHPTAGVSNSHDFVLGGGLRPRLRNWIDRKQNSDQPSTDEPVPFSCQVYPHWIIGILRTSESQLPSDRKIRNRIRVERLVGQAALNRAVNRSEERRVGKEGRSRWSPYH